MPRREEKIETFASNDTRPTIGKTFKVVCQRCTPKPLSFSPFTSMLILVKGGKYRKRRCVSSSRDVIIIIIIILQFQLRKYTNTERRNISLPDGRKFAQRVSNVSPLNRAQRIILQIAASKARSLLYDRKMTNALPRTEIKIRYCRY